MTTASNKPTHRAYAISKRGDKSHWQDIGAAWTHKDGKGFNLKLDYLPLNGAELALRIADAETGDATSRSEGGV
ncbi:MAG: hypothetical protein EKK41_12770 [Hyphomicrobiales bacterium]|nr:MAG: hypothetical protein EKK41_12770 [Hyphomicrobiales bacterium]